MPNQITNLCCTFNRNMDSDVQWYNGKWYMRWKSFQWEWIQMKIVAVEGYIFFSRWKEEEEGATIFWCRKDLHVQSYVYSLLLWTSCETDPTSKKRVERDISSYMMWNERRIFSLTKHTTKSSRSMRREKKTTL